MKIKAVLQIMRHAIKRQNEEQLRKTLTQCRDMVTELLIANPPTPQLATVVHMPPVTTIDLPETPINESVRTADFTTGR